MSEWLDLMLDEISRRQREERESLQEAERRAELDKKASGPIDGKPAQPK